MSVIFDINHEAGDFSEYNATSLDEGDCSIQVAAALAGTSYGMQCFIDDTNQLYGNAWLGADNTSGRVRARFYIDPNGLTMGTADVTNVLYLFRNFDYNTIANVTLTKTATPAYAIRGEVYDDVSSQQTSDYEITDAPHYIEIDVLRATGESSNDGSFTLYIDGVLKQTISGVDNYNAFSVFRAIQLGSKYPTATVSGTFFLDELVVNDDGSEIGPLEEGITINLDVA